MFVAPKTARSVKVDRIYIKLHHFPMFAIVLPVQDCRVNRNGDSDQHRAKSQANERSTWLACSAMVVVIVQ
jgi:hypothetical protein